LKHNDDFLKVHMVYPVLIVHDALLGAPVFGNFLASEFKDCLVPDEEYETGVLRKGRLNIAPLIIMTIDDLENLENSVEHFGLRDLFSDYTKECPDRLTSLYNFISLSKYGKKMYHSRSVATQALDLLEETEKMVFSS